MHSGQGIYREDGGKAFVTVLEDTSDEKKESFKLKITKVVQQPIIGPPWKAGEEFDVFQIRGHVFGGMWTLMLDDSEANVEKPGA
jgi:hypothetical protein